MIVRIRKTLINKDLIAAYGKNTIFETMRFKTMEQFYHYCKKVNDNSAKYGFVISHENFKLFEKAWTFNRKVK